MNKYKTLAINTIIFAIGGFGSKILLFFLTRLYSANIGPADSSTRELLEIMTNFLIPIFTFSLSEAIIRYGLDKKYDKRKVFSTSCVLVGLGYLLMLVIVPILRFVPFLDFIKGYTVLLILYVFASGFRSICSQFVRARGLVKLFSVDGILATITLFILNVVFISVLDMGVKGYMLSVILSDFMSALFLYAVAGLNKFMKLKYYSPRLAKSMMKFALPLIPTTIMWVITSLSDRLFIRYMHSDTVQLGAEATGIYGYAAKIPNLIQMVSTIFFQAWNMSAITENDSADRSDFYEKVYSSYQSIMFIASAFLVAGVQIITPIFVSSGTFSEYSNVYLYTPILVVAVMYMCLNQFFGIIYTATKHTKNSFWTSLIACVVNIILNIILIPTIGIQGASIATFASYFVCFCVRVVDARRFVPFRVNHGRTIINTAILLALSYAVINQPMYYPVYLVCGFLYVMVCNYRGLTIMVKKLLRRG